MCLRNAGQHGRLGGAAGVQRRSPILQPGSALLQLRNGQRPESPRGHHRAGHRLPRRPGQTSTRRNGSRPGRKVHHLRRRQPPLSLPPDQGHHGAQREGGERSVVPEIPQDPDAAGPAFWVVSVAAGEAEPRDSPSGLRGRRRLGLLLEGPRVLRAAWGPLGRQTLDRHLHRRELGRPGDLELQLPLPEHWIVQRELPAPAGGVCRHAGLWVVQQLLRALEPQPRPSGASQLALQCLGEFWIVGQFSAKPEQHPGGVFVQHLPVEFAVDGQGSADTFFDQHQRTTQPEFADGKCDLDRALAFLEHAADKPVQTRGLGCRKVGTLGRSGRHVQHPNGEHHSGRRQRIWRARLVKSKNTQRTEAQDKTDFQFECWFRFIVSIVQLRPVRFLPVVGRVGGAGDGGLHGLCERHASGISIGQRMAFGSDGEHALLRHVQHAWGRPCEGRASRLGPESGGELQPRANARAKLGHRCGGSGVESLCLGPVCAQRSS